MTIAFLLLCIAVLVIASHLAPIPVGWIALALTVCAILAGFLGVGAHLGLH